jgi:carbamoyl-phosphate synthase large subunit
LQTHRKLFPSDKWRTFEYLKRDNISRAESPLVEDQDRFIRESGFPLVVKPREGHGSLHVYIAKSHDDIKNAILEIERAGWNPILREYLPAQDQEYTTGVTIDQMGNYAMSSTQRDAS